MVIIQADNDYSAEFALALMSLTAVITIASQNMRILTLSWEGIHPTTKSLFGPYGAPRLFKLQNVRRDPPLIRLPPGQEISDIIGNIPDTTLNFSQLTFTTLGECR